ncbi:MAG: hypothetical protein FWG09_02350, partial [Synergistaceae bacterium]|nr:hypothetical protein [Synergistaceae bacterium]
KQKLHVVTLANVCFVVFAPLARRRSIYANETDASRAAAGSNKQGAGERSEPCESLSFFIKAASSMLDLELE